MRTARQPNFLVAGAQKSGTSYLCSILARHPAVFHTAPKEPMFFQQENVTEASFASYLASFYRDAANQPRVGEGSTIYFQWPHALHNIRRWLGPQVEIIVSLRQPTDRAVSFYLHNLRKGRIRGDERIADVGSFCRHRSLRAVDRPLAGTLEDPAGIHRTGNPLVAGTAPCPLRRSGPGFG
jgi:hypothetical protein